MSANSFNSLTFSLLLTRPSAKTMVESRSALERDIFELIMQDDEKLQEALEKLKENLAHHKELIKAGASAEALAENDMDFHKILSANCGNTLLQMVYDYVMDAFRYNIIATTANQKVYEDVTTVYDHTTIIKALENRSFSDAKQIAQITADSWYRLLQDEGDDKE